MDAAQLQRLITVRMPYGKYQGRRIAPARARALNTF